MGYLKRIRKTWSDIPGRWVLIGIALSLALIHLSSRYNLLKISSSSGYKILDTLIVMMVVLIGYWLVMAMKARLRVPYLLTAILYTTIQFLTLYSVSAGFQPELLTSFDLAFLAAALTIGITGYFVSLATWIHAVLFVVMAGAVMWNMPSSRDFLEIVFTNRTIWENKPVTLKTDRNKTLYLSIPRKYFHNGWYDKDVKTFYHLEFSYPDMQPAHKNRNIHQRFLLYLFRDHHWLATSYHYRPRKFPPFKNPVIDFDLKSKNADPSIYIPIDTKRHPLYFFCSRIMGVTTREQIFRSKHVVCMRNPLSSTGLQYRYWIRGDQLLHWKAVELIVKRKIRSFIVSGKNSL